MTIFEVAKKIADNGMQENEVFRFFQTVNKDITDLIILFDIFGISYKLTWNLYEKWQDS